MFALPKFITDILDILHTAGFEAFVVGGAVRDMLLGNEPNDFDITTSCPPEITVTLFDKTVNTGIKHGTVTVVTECGNVEVTTYRRDLSYTNHRKPDNVDFISNLYEDLKRRDFTVNAFALSRDGNITDEFGGLCDLNNKIIRAVGVPQQRFFEDALRILRAFRFSAKLDFDIEEQTFKAALENAHLLKNISCERIFSELKQTLLSDNPEKIEALINTGAFEHLHINKANSLKPIKYLPRNFRIRFFEFCRLTQSHPLLVCKSLKADNDLFDYCNSIQKLFECNCNDDDIGIKNSLNLVGVEILKDYYLLNGKSDEKIDRIILNNEPYKIAHLNIKGDDIIALSVSGKNVGTVLEYLLDKVIKQPNLNNKETLLSLAKEFIKPNAQ